MRPKWDQSHAAAGRAACCAAATVAIGHALQLSGGLYDRNSLWWLAGGIVLAWCGVVLPWGRRWIFWCVCLGGFLWQIGQLNIEPLLPTYAAPWQFYLVFLPIMTLAGVAAMSNLPIARQVGLPILLATYLITGALLIHFAPRPIIDLYEASQEACKAITHGHNPYAIDFADPYAGWPHAENSFYPPGSIKNGRVQTGYFYPPLDLAAGEMSYLVSGDFRYANLVCVTAAAALLGYAADGWAPAAGAVLLLTAPQGFFVLVEGWTEPLIVLLVAATVFCAMRASQLLPWIFGLLVASKQHMFLAAPAALLLIAGPWTWRAIGAFFLKAAIIAVAVTLPFVLWNPHAFWHSTVEWHFMIPFRADSLSFAAAWAHWGHAPPPSIVGFGAGLATAALAVWRAPRTPAGFAVALAVTYLSLFALAPEAFCNYYFMCIGMLCCAVAAWK